MKMLSNLIEPIFRRGIKRSEVTTPTLQNLRKTKKRWKKQSDISTYRHSTIRCKIYTPEGIHEIINNYP
jgi:hypothetical protein